MATLSTAAKNAALDAIATLLDSGSTTVGPYLRFSLANLTRLARRALSSSGPTWSAASGGAASLVVAPITMPIVTQFGGETSGTIALCDISDRSGSLHATLTVGLTGSGLDVELDSLNFAAGQVMVANSFDLSLP